MGCPGERPLHVMAQRGGDAIRFVTDRLSEQGYRWAYRVVDTRSFGIPQRRRRVLIVASKREDPRTVLFTDDGDLLIPDDGKVPCGFSWTEGRAGLGWAVNAVPTLKGGSALGIPSPPAIWMRNKGTLVTPEIRDAERLQGFPVDWTVVEVGGRPIRIGHRWKLVGNAVSVPVARWLGSRLVSPGYYDELRNNAVWSRRVWPNAAWGAKGKVRRSQEISECPVPTPALLGLERFYIPTSPLSEEPQPDS